MGIEEKGQICVMIHSGSRGFGHQVATGLLDKKKNIIKYMFFYFNELIVYYLFIF